MRDKSAIRHHSWALPPPPRSGLPEWLDAPERVSDDLAANLRDIRNLNRWFGGLAAVLEHVGRQTQDRETCTVLDVGTGSGDVPLAIKRWGRRTGREVDVVGLDRSPEVLHHAHRYVSKQNLRLVRGDARALPYRDNSFDLVTCCLSLHHFDFEDGQLVLKEMWRVARRATIVIDLVRSYPCYAAVWLASRSLAPNRVTRHDAPLSVLRAFTAPELLEMCRTVWGESTRSTRHRFCRQAVVAAKTIA